MRKKDITAQGIASLSSSQGKASLRLRALITDGPAGMAGRHVELYLDQPDLDWLLGHLALRPQYAGVLQAVAGELAAMEAVRNDPGASVIAKMQARPDDIGAYNRMRRVVQAAREAQQAREEGP